MALTHSSNAETLPESEYPKEKKRYVFIDALRGIAAFGVLFHHMLHNSVMEVALRKVLPTPLIVLSNYGAMGVQIFFVISGFVIAFSLRDLVISRKIIFNFILRRQVRLDPPYWAIILLTLCVDKLRLMMPALKAHPLPSLWDTAKNLFYLQNITHANQIVGVSWTLCLEVQFYLVLIAMLGLSASAASGRAPRGAGRLAAFLVCGLGVASLFVSQVFPLPVLAPWFIAYWFYFAAGVLCFWSLDARVSHLTFLAFVITFAGFIVYHCTPATVTGFTTVLLLYAVGRAGHLTDWLNNSLLQYFGRISYSLYLVHLLIAVSILQLGYKMTGDNTRYAVVWFVLAGLCSVGVAHLLHVLIERPSARFASRLKSRSVQSTTVGVMTP